jgi:transcriptional regulator with XRE-family HTH domain
VDLEQAFRCRLRQHRQAAGMTQEPLAEPVGISTKTIERGVVASPFDAVERIASALQRSPALFGAGDEVVPKGERGRLLARIQATLAEMSG